MQTQQQDGRAGWRVKPWSNAAGCCPARTWKLIKDNRIKSVKFGKSRIITTSPREFLESLAKEQAA